MPLSGDSRARLLRMRASQNRELEIISNAIEVDRASITQNKQAISGIEQAIKRSKAALVTYNSNMNSLKESESRLKQFSQVHIEENPSSGQDSSTTYRRANALITSGASSELRCVEEQKKNLHTRIVDLNSVLCSLERELHECNVELVLSEASLAVHTTVINGTYSSLEIVNAVLSPIKQVPPEVWVEIFRIVAIESGGDDSHILSVAQVSREWRAISLRFTQLWTRIVIPPAPWWPQAELDSFNLRLERAGDCPVTFVVHLRLERKWETQALASKELGSLYIHSDHVYYEKEVRGKTNRAIPWGGSVQKYKSTYRKGYSGTSRRDLISIEPSLRLKKYSIHFHMGSVSELEERRVLLIPFNTPESVTIEAPNPREATFSNIFSPFNKLTRLTLLNVWPNDPHQLGGITVDLKYVRFSTSVMVPFDFSPLLSLSLEELHVEHGCGNTFSPLPEVISLPRLRTLAVTLHECSFCSMLEFPALQTLIVHSSASVRDPEFTLDFFKSSTQFRQIKHLCFCDWTELQDGSTALEVIKHVVVASTHLTELTFTRCRVDIPALISVVTQSDSRFKVINLVSCVGITQADCESLSRSVENLKISV
jgi:F-box-like